MKHDLALNSATGSPFRDTEMKGTVYEGDFELLDVQFKGLPGDEVAPENTFAARNILRLDFGSANETAFSFDLSKELSNGFYRAIVVTSRHADFPFRATASLVGRLQYVGGQPDPWTGETMVHAIHSANLLKSQSNSTILADAGFGEAFESMWIAEANGTNAPTKQQWTYGPASACGTTCSAWLNDGVQYVATNGTVNARFWAINDKAAPSQMPLDTCRFAYPNGGSCA